MTQPLNVLIGCEALGKVRDAFRRAGHNAWSSDILDPDDLPPEYTRTQQYPNYHLTGDVRLWLDGTRGPVDHWDLAIFFPTCTHLAVSGARWFKDKQAEQREAIAFFIELAEAKIPRVAVENPIGIMSTSYRKPDQIVQPWQFGHGETKATCLWLRNLPKLTPTNIVAGRVGRVHHESPGPLRWLKRSETYQGIADAMALQWGGVVAQQVSL